MIKRVTKDELEELLDEYFVPLTSASCSGELKEELQVGKITLCIKQGRRRHLINGRVKELGFQPGGHGHPGYLVRQFVPNNVEKVRKVCGKA